MLRLRNWQGAAVVLACCGLLVPQTVVAAEKPVASRTAEQVAQKSADIALTKDRQLVGAAYTPDGRQLDGAQVVITQNGKEIVRTNTDANGAFAIAQMKTGSYQIGIGDKVAPIRVWTNETAPPKSKQKAILVTGEIVRGQDTYFESGHDGPYESYPEYCPDGNCPPAGGGPLLGLDIITLATVGAATTAAVVTIINLNKLNDIEDKLDSVVSP
jgi:hypothetical protein